MDGVNVTPPPPRYLVACAICGSQGWFASSLDPTMMLAIHTAAAHPDKVPDAQLLRLDALYGAGGSRRN